MKICNVAIAILVFFSISSFAQNNPSDKCGYDYFTNQLIENDPNYASELDTYLKSIPKLSQEHSASRSVIMIPIVIHVIHKGQPIGVSPNLTESRILSQIETLNKDFSRTNADASQTPATFQDNAVDTDIRFCLAVVDPEGNPTDGIIRHEYSNIPSTEFINNTIKTQTGWDPLKYLNIWTVPMPASNSNILGFTYLPSQSIIGSSLDGLVIAHDRFGLSNISRGRTTTHEMGHYLGLPHIWGSNQSCAVDDGVSDTPICNGPYYGCPSFPQSSCGSTDMYMNFMDYVNDECMNLFTFGQTNVMHAVLNGTRSSLVNNAATACDIDVSTTEIDLSSAVTLFPNPASEQVSILLEGNDFESKVMIQIMDASGKLINQFQHKSSSIIDLDICELELGIYFVCIQSGTNIINKKLLVID